MCKNEKRSNEIGINQGLGFNPRNLILKFLRVPSLKSYSTPFTAISHLDCFYCLILESSLKESEKGWNVLQTECSLVILKEKYFINFCTIVAQNL